MARQSENMHSSQAYIGLHLLTSWDLERLAARLAEFIFDLARLPDPHGSTIIEAHEAKFLYGFGLCVVLPHKLHLSNGINSTWTDEPACDGASQRRCDVVYRTGRDHVNEPLTKAMDGLTSSTVGHKKQHATYSCG